MTEWASSNTMLVLLGIAFVLTAGWGIVVLFRSRWLDEYGKQED